jgi:hypothetical protein
VKCSINISTVDVDVGADRVKNQRIKIYLNWK